MTGGVFIAGTDTGVGKTVVSCLLTEALRRTGRRVGVMKPYAAGGWQDTDDLIRAAGGRLSRREVTPVFWRRPLAPGARDLEAETEVPGELRRIAEAYRRWARACDAMVVEGVGGVLCPLGGGRSAAELPVRLRLPSWLVARPSLGTLNHTLLSIEALRRRRVPVLRVVVSGYTGRDAAERGNPLLIARLTGLPVTVLPRLSGAGHRRRIVETWSALFS